MPNSEQRKPLRVIAWVLGLIVGLPVAAAAVLVLLSIVLRSDPAAHVPAGFTVYASVPSAGSFITEVLDLKAVDALLSAPEFGAARGLVRSIRSQPFIHSAAFARLANVRVDAAMYGDGGFVAVVSLGYRSAALRLLPLAPRLAPALMARLNGLTWVPDAVPPRFEYSPDTGGDGSTLYAKRSGDLLVVASSEKLLQGAMRPEAAGVDPVLAAALRAHGDSSLRFLADPVTLVPMLTGGTVKGEARELLARLDFGALAMVDLKLADDRISLSVDLGVSSSDEALAALLGRRSTTPAMLSRLPESAAYFSLLSAGKPAALWKSAEQALGPTASSAYKRADETARTAFGLGMDDLLFSWMGDEFGLYGSSLGPDPVFFVSIADEKARRSVFEKAFGSLLVGRDISALVGDTRVPRIVFPGFLRAFLETLGVRLVEPFYLVEDGYLYIGASAELLAACVAETREGRLLVKTERWKDGALGVSPESSASIFYSQGRSVPFFMRGSSALSAALGLYGRGVASVRFSGDRLVLELSAVEASGPGMSGLPGFPLPAGGRMTTDPVVGRSGAGAPMGYWVNGKHVVAVDLSSGARNETVMDDSGWIVVDAPGPAAADALPGAIRAVWAVSERGTVYRMDAGLAALQGFPLVTGQAVSGPPAVAEGRLVVPVSKDPALMLVGADASIRFSGPFGARSRSKPAVSAYALAALPRSFESELYLMDGSGAILPGWPVQLSGIASASPAFALADASGSAQVLAITEAGDLSAFGGDAAPATGFPVRLDGTFDGAPAWAPLSRSIFAVSAEGILWKVGLDGARLGQTPVAPAQAGRLAARGVSVVAIDADGDGREELYVAGGGDALYAFSGDLSALPGYPVSGSGVPAFIDIDGDGSLDIVTRGADDTVRAYRGR